MSASFSLASATVDITPAEASGEQPSQRTKVQVVCRNGKATLKTDRGKNVEQAEGVLESVKINRNEWRVTFHDGTVWAITRTKGGCRSCG